MKTLKNIAKRSREIRRSKDIFSYSGAVAFYMIFSFPAIVLIILVLTRRIIDDEIMLAQIQNGLDYFVSSNIADNILNITQNYIMHQSSDVQIFLAVILTIYIAAFSIITVERGMNYIRNGKASGEGGGIVAYLKSHIKALTMISLAALGSIGLIFANIIINIIQNNTGSEIVSANALRRNQILILGTVYVTTYFCYKLLIYKPLPKKITHIGAALFTIVFIPMKEIIRLYLGRGSTNTIYAATSSLVMMILWIYFVSLVFFSTVCITKATHETITNSA